MTTRRWAAIAGAVAVVFVAGMVRIGWQGLHDWQASRHRCDIPSSLAGYQRTSAHSAPGGGGIRVVEQGFTDGVNSETSLGAILTNTSSLVAYRTSVSYRVYQGERQLATLGDVAQQIPILLPGQSIGIGELVAAGHPVTSFEVIVQDTQWVPRTALGKNFGTVTTTVPRTERNPKLPWVARITVTDSVTSCRDLVLGPVATVYRDRTGAIVGGSSDLPFGDFACQRGRNPLTIIGVMAPVAADDGRTETYPYCDVGTPALPASPP